MNDNLIRRALCEDAADNDITTHATVPRGQVTGATITAKAKGVLSGCTVAEACMRSVEQDMEITWHHHDGEHVAPDEAIVTLHGSTRAILAAERSALNFLQHLSGIATATAQFVARVAGTGCAIFDTRKTVPGLRTLAKQAVIHGGGHNHRADLAGGFLIKENHITAAGSLSTAIQRCRATENTTWIEVECETLGQVEEALELCPELILLDNMSVNEVRQARDLVPKRSDGPKLEVSGGITLANVRSYAETGVERIAIGAITHSAPALDLSLLLR